MEAQGDPLKGVLPTLQTSLTLPELPCTATAAERVKTFFAFGLRLPHREVLVCREVRGGKKCGYRV